MPYIAKRCPNGYHINPDTNRCEPIDDTQHTKDTPAPGKEKKGNKCPPGKHKHKGAMSCHPIGESHATNPEARKWHKEHADEISATPTPAKPRPKYISPRNPMKSSPKEYGYDAKKTYKIKENKDTERIRTFDTGDKVFNEVINGNRKEVLSALEDIEFDINDSRARDYYKAYNTLTHEESISSEQAEDFLGTKPKRIKRKATIKDTYNAIGMLRNVNSKTMDVHKALDDAIGNLVRIDSSVDTVHGYMTQGIVHSFADVIELCPYALMALGTINCKSEKKFTMAYGDYLREITFNSQKYKFYVGEYESYVVKDPKTKEDTKWKFNFGKSGADAIAHEYGHAVAHLLTRLSIFKSRNPDISVSERYKKGLVQFDIEHDCGTLLTMSYPDIYDNICTEVIDECKSLYEETYGEFNPSDIWSGYGFSGIGAFSETMDADADTKRYALRSSERIAEAFCDVATRKSKANTMSKLVVSCVNHRIENYLLGKTPDFSSTFRKAVKDNGKPELIVKRYIPYGLLKTLD